MVIGTVPGNDVVFIRDDARLQADQRIEDLERGSWQESFRTAFRVITNVKIIIEIIQHKRRPDSLRNIFPAPAAPQQQDGLARQLRAGAAMQCSLPDGSSTKI